MGALDNYPILQVAAAIITFFVSVVLMIRARKSNEALPPSASMPQGVQMFMQGPIVAALDTLKAIQVGQREQTDMLRRIEQSADRARDALRDAGDRARDETDRVRDALRDTSDRSSEQLQSIEALLAKVVGVLRRVPGARP